MDGPRSVRPTHNAVPAAHLFFLSAHPFHPAVETRHKARLITKVTYKLINSKRHMSLHRGEPEQCVMINEVNAWSKH